jgi:hypothetical protein
VDSERRVSAALRLKHDLGKAVRWNAPFGRERDPEAFRRRLEKDLLRTRRGGDRDETAVEVFDRWLAENGFLFRDGTGSEEALGRVQEAVDAIRPLLSRISRLGADELVALDEASVRIASRCRELWLEAVSMVSADPEGPAP